MTTQIEGRLIDALRACQFYFKTQGWDPDAGDEAVAGIQATIDWYDRTRSDTRKQAAASPSAAGEGRPVAYIGMLNGEPHSQPTIDRDELVRGGYEDADIAALGILSSQAPKPASAGGDEDEAFYERLSRTKFFLSPDDVELAYDGGIGFSDASSQKDTAQLVRIAAEADTAKVRKVRPGWESRIAEPPTPAVDRLAPIEARGAVTDELANEIVRICDLAHRATSPFVVMYRDGRSEKQGEVSVTTLWMLCAAAEEVLSVHESAPAVEVIGYIDELQLSYIRVEREHAKQCGTGGAPQHCVARIDATPSGDHNIELLIASRTDTANPHLPPREGELVGEHREPHERGFDIKCPRCRLIQRWGPRFLGNPAIADLTDLK